ncbi:hypothetical protein Tco_1026262, partial [Tanacetum coccineum]
MSLGGSTSAQGRRHMGLGSQGPERQQAAAAVYDLQRDVVGLRRDVASFSTEQSRVSTWLISCMSQLMDANGQTYQPFNSTLVGTIQRILGFGIRRIDPCTGIMDDPNITMEEYIRHQEEKAQRAGRTFNWQTATYGKVKYYKDEDDCFTNFESEFLAHVNPR